MKKLYVFLAIFMALFCCTNTYAQNTATCTANFEFRDTIVYSPFAHNITFTAIASSAPSKVVTKVCWNFGDGKDTCINAVPGTAAASLLTIKHTYPPSTSTLATYNVCVTIYYDGGCTAQSCRSITLQSPGTYPPDTCKADFYVLSRPSNVLTNSLTNYFVATPASNRKPVLICWNFGDGSNQVCQDYAGTFTGTYATSHTFPAAGTYQVCVTIKYDGGCEARQCHTIEVHSPVITPDSCGADINILNTPTISLLSRYFTAVTKHNHDKKPVQICWTFGDGSAQVCQQYAGGTYTGTYATSHNFPHSGQYEVCVDIKYDGGCESKKCILVSIPPVVTPDSCSAGFTVNALNSTGSALGRIFTALPKHNHDKKPLLITWSFGDGSTQTLTYAGSYTGTYTIGHNYTAPGKYQVCVGIQYDGGCESRKCDSITIPSIVTPDSCSASFTVTSSSANALIKHFTAVPKQNHDKKPVYICWTFGDGSNQYCQQYANTYTGTYTAEHNYANYGTYQVCVDIHYDGGCESRKCDTVRIPSPVVPDSCGADFNVEPAAANSLTRYFFAVPKHNHNKKPLSICWTFGDGSAQACQQYAGTFTGTYVTNHTYAHSGQYEVCVVIHYDGGCESKQCHTITIASPDTCGADFTVVSTTPAGTVNNSLSRYFIAQPKQNHDKKPVYICWTFGDGSNQYCQQYAATYTGTYAAGHTYANPGQYEVCVTITYDGGCQGKQCHTITIPPVVTPDSCGASFSVLSTTANSLLEYFVATPKHNHDKKPLSVCWTFGDGSTQVCQQYAGTYTGTYATSHTFPHEGQYEVCVVIHYDGGCESRKCQTITVPPIIRPDSCGASFTVVAAASNTLSRFFTAVPKHNHNKKPLQVCWNFGDGSNQECQTYSGTYTGTYTVDHTYANYGQYQVCVVIHYDGGCESKSCQTVNIERPKCEANITEVATNISNLERKFYVGLMNNAPAQKICWSFGDGVADTCVAVPNPVSQDALVATHKYPGPGTYHACVKVFYANGCIAEKCIEVTIRPATTNTCGGYLTDVVTGTRTVLFKGFGIQTSPDSVITYSWSFGDGTTGSGKEISHTYATGGTYQVCLHMKTRSGCETTICTKVSFDANAQPQLTLTPNPATVVLHATFLSLRAETVSVRIYNANGLVVRSYTKSVSVGTNTWDFSDIGTLPIGVYSVIVMSPTQFADAIFFKQ